MTARLALLLGLLLAAASPADAGQPAETQRFTGAFVTMTEGVRCPSNARIAFRAQGAATGPLSGIFDLRGSMEVAVSASGRAPSVRAFHADLDVNQGRILGSVRWDRADPPLQLSCDPLGLRIEGTLRYAVDGVGTGTLDVQAYGSRNAVTMPYFGRTTMNPDAGDSLAVLMTTARPFCFGIIAA